MGIEILIALGLSAVLAYFRISRKPDRFNVVYAPTDRNRCIIERCPSINKEFTCSVIENGHVSTVMSYFTRPAAMVKYVRTHIGVSAVDWVFEGRDRLVLMVPGLFSASDRPYIMNAARYFSETGGFDVGVIAFPGNGTKLVRHHAWFDMVPYITEVMNYLAMYSDYKHICLVGFSNGGNSVINYMALTIGDANAVTGEIEEPNRENKTKESPYPNKTTDSDALPGSVRIRSRSSDGLPREGVGYTIKPTVMPAAAVTISQNFNARIAYEKLHRLYDSMFASNIKALIWDEWGVQITGSTVTEIEKNLTCRQFGFSDVGEMMESFSCYKRFGDLTCPVLVIIAEDDPITRADAIPYYAVEGGNVIIATSRTGGHLGWSGGFAVSEEGGRTSHNILFPDDVNAADQIAVEFLNAVVGLPDAGHPTNTSPSTTCTGDVNGSGLP